jgi:hypothetical protein
MELEEGQRGHFGIPGLQSSILQGSLKEGRSLLCVTENPAPTVKIGNSMRIEINILKAFFDIAFNLT